MKSLSTFLLLFIFSRVSNRESATVSGFRIWDEHGERICMGSLDPGINQENAIYLNSEKSRKEFDEKDGFVALAEGALKTKPSLTEG